MEARLNDAAGPQDRQASALCVRGSNIWLNHDWSAAGTCTRCGRPIPKKDSAREHQA